MNELAMYLHGRIIAKDCHIDAKGAHIWRFYPRGFDRHYLEYILKERRGLELVKVRSIFGFRRFTLRAISTGMFH